MGWVLRLQPRRLILSGMDILAAAIAERDRLNKVIALLTPPGTTATHSTPKKAAKPMSLATKQKLRNAAKARWVKIRAEQKKKG